jgi:tetratricopeptide (TPR) repeat protein
MQALRSAPLLGHRRGLALLCLVIALALSASARAQAPSEDHDLVEARKHAQRGLSHFNLQEYDRAIVEFEEAYRLRPDPSLLYNLAQSHRLAGHDERAIYFYRAFLRSAPNAEIRPEVERRIAEMERAKPKEPSAAASAPKPTPGAAPRPVAAAAPDAAPAPVAAPASLASAPSSPSKPSVSASDAIVATAPPAAKTPVYKKWWLWTAVGGAVAIGLGVGLGVGLGTSSSGALPSTTFGAAKPF